MIVFAQMALGFALLLGGAELLVRAAARLARAAGITPLVVGLTVVAYGTSAPELAVSVQAALSGRPALAIGNAVGSNSFNLLVILGAAALITPLATTRQLIRLDLPLMLGSALVLWAVAADGTIGQGDGLGCLLLGLAYTVLQIRRGRREARLEAQLPGDGQPGTLGGPVARCLVGLALLVVGARWLVEGAVAMATALGVSQLVIGLTIVAAGTSLPEVATSLVAAARGQRDLAIGNIVGSNVFNALWVLGTAAATSGVPVSPAALSFDFPVMVLASVACLPMLASGWQLSRLEGALMLLSWLLYTLVLVGTPATFPMAGWGAVLLVSLPLVLAVVAPIVRRRHLAPRRVRIAPRLRDP